MNQVRAPRWAPAWRRRAREAVPTAVLAAVIYVPLLLTKPGKVGADTKTYLYLDPSRMLGRAASMWDPNIGMGTVTHQNIGYLWPIGPWYWLAEAAHLPDWVAQRLWLGSILFVAGLGVRYLLKVLGQEGPHVTAATFLYALTPYTLTLAARLSVILLPYAGLPWMIAFTVLALRRGGWRYPALFALTVATVGSVNATALILAGVAPLLWIFCELVITREATLRQAAAAVGRIGVLTVGCSLWWIAGLWAQGGYGIEILRYTETAETVGTGSVAPEVFRSLGYWFFYGQDTYGPWIAASKAYTQRLWLIFLTYLLPVLALLGAAVARFRDRAFFALLALAGFFLAIGGHPWDHPSPAGRGVKAFLLSDLGLSMRSLPRAVPLLALALAVFLGSGIASIAALRPKLGRPLTAVAVLLAILALPPLWTGGFVDDNLDRPEAIPSYWKADIAALDARGHDTRVLELPGEDFASYRWGTTVDPITPGLMDRPYVARELIPYGSPPSAQLLNAFDQRLQEGTLDPDAIAPVARFMGVGDLNVRADITYERYNTPRPRLLWQLVRSAPGLGTPLRFGSTARNTPRADLPMQDETELATSPSLPDPPQVAIVPVERTEKIVRAAAADHPVVVAGDGDGLVTASGAGLLTGHELVRYAASEAGDAKALRAAVGDDGVLLLTDTNRKEALRWGTVRENTGFTERAGQDDLRADPKDQRLEVFPDQTPADQTVTESGPGAGAWAEATSYGNAVSLTPEDQAAYAIDGDPATGRQDLNTAWRTGGFESAEGESIRIHYARPVTTGKIRLLQAQGGVRNRFITQVQLRFDGGDPVTADLTEASRDRDDRQPDGGGQIIDVPERTFRTLDVEITKTDPGTLPRYDGISAVGFAAIDVAPGAEGPVGSDVVRLPTDLLRAVGRASQDHPLAILLTRRRTAPTNAVRGDEERALARRFTLPTARSFALSGQVRLSNGASDAVIDRVLGLPDAEHGGITATSSRRIPGGFTSRASNAIDGDPDTWWSPGFLDNRGEHVTYTSAERRSFSSMDLTVLNDGRHSVPRRLVIRADGKEAATVTVPDVPDQKAPNARHTFHLTFPRVTGKRIEVAVDLGEDALRDVKTIDYYTGKPIIMPIGIVELGIPGLRVEQPSGPVDDRCRTDLLTVDGRPVGVSLQGEISTLLAGDPVSLRACDGKALRLPAGRVDLRAAAGVGRPGQAPTGLDLDQLALRSAPGGGADTARGPLSPTGASTAARPQVRVTHTSRTAMDVVVSGATAGSWVVLGQSHNLGWKATVDGKDLGPPKLVDGYANGWRVPSDRKGPVTVHIEWAPQRVVWGAIAASVAAILAALVLILWPRRSGDAEAESRPPLDLRPAMPRPFRLGRLLRYSGPQPGAFATVGTVAGALVGGGLLIGPLAGVLLAVVATLAMRFQKARPLLTLGSPGLLAVSAAYILAKQVIDRLPAGFDWPTYFDAVHQVAWGAMALLVLDVVVDRCWLRRWWPTDDSPV